MLEQLAGAKSQAVGIADRLPALLLAAQRIAATIEQGVHGRRRVGPGETFWQYRLYYQGDELRRLDWRQSAKSDRLYLRQMEWSAAQTVYLWCDLSPSMDFRSRRDLPTKAEAALTLCLALAGVLARAGERVAVLGGAERPVTGKNVMEAIARRLLASSTPASQSAKSASVPPAMALPAYAHVILIGDFLTPVENLAQTIEGFAKAGCRGHLLQVLDPAEVDLPYQGRIRFEGSEGEGWMLMSRAETVRSDYSQALGQHWLAVREAARLARWSTTRHVSDQSATLSLLALYQWLAQDQPRVA